MVEFQHLKSLGPRPAWSTELVSEQPRLHKEILYQKQTNKDKASINLCENPGLSHLESVPLVIALLSKHSAPSEAKSRTLGTILDEWDNTTISIKIKPGYEVMPRFHSGSSGSSGKSFPAKPPRQTRHTNKAQQTMKNRLMPNYFQRSSLASQQYKSPRIFIRWAASAKS